jgi:hypothetical protein
MQPPASTSCGLMVSRGWSTRTITKQCRQRHGRKWTNLSVRYIITRKQCPLCFSRVQGSSFSTSCPHVCPWTQSTLLKRLLGDRKMSVVPTGEIATKGQLLFILTVRLATTRGQPLDNWSSHGSRRLSFRPIARMWPV